GYTRTSYAPSADDPDDPGRILMRLESTVRGCNWLLARWGELSDLLKPGLSWQPVDKFRAVRLLGKQPLDAPDVPDVCLIFLACHVIQRQHSCAFDELYAEFDWEFTQDLQQYLRRLNARPWKALEPKTQDDARAALQGLVDKARARLHRLIDYHQRRAEEYAADPHDLLAFDPSDEAERLRRHEKACNREIYRSLDRLMELRE